MERRARGDERPVSLPWSNVAAALGGGLWGGTLVTLVGDTGTGKTQWALQAAIHAAESGVPVCYVAPDSGVDQSFNGTCFDVDRDFAGPVEESSSPEDEERALREEE